MKHNFMNENNIHFPTGTNPRNVCRHEVRNVNSNKHFINIKKAAKPVRNVTFLRCRQLFSENVICA